MVRYGNVLESRGSVIPLFKEQRKKGVVTLTDNDMTRFSISLEDGVNMVLWTIQNSLGGEIVVPKVPSFGIRELAKIIAPGCKIKVIGKRLGEKIHESRKNKIPVTLIIGEKDAKNKSVAINYLDGSEEQDIELSEGIKSINKKLKKPVFKI